MLLAKVECGDLAWGMAAQFLQYGSAILVLPFMVTCLPGDQVGLWFVFIAMQSVVSIVDSGFAPTYARNFSFVFAGVQKLKYKGVSDESGSLNQELLADLIASSRLLYAGMAVGIGIVLLWPGSYYIMSLVKTSPGARPEWISWWVFVFAVVVNVYFSWYTSLLIGAGRVRGNYQVGILNRGGFSVLACVGLFFRGGILSVSVAFLIGAIISRVYAGILVGPLLKNIPKVCWSAKYKNILELLKIVWHNSYKSGLVAFGAFLITRFGVFVVTSFCGLIVSGQYSVSLQVFSVIMSLSQTALCAFIPRLSMLRVSGEKNEFRNLFLISSFFTWTIFCLLSVFVILFGNQLLNLMHSNTMLLSRDYLIIMAVVWLLEANHAGSAAVIATGNSIPFMPAALVSGLLICLLSLVSAALGFGLIGVIFCQGVVQLAYNNWKWPMAIYSELDIRLSDIFSLVASSLRWFFVENKKQSL